MTTMTLWQHEVSPYADKIRRAAHLKGLDLSIREVRLMETPKLKAVSPSGKFPVLEVAGQYIVDSTNILDFLENEYAEPSLTPADPRDAAMARLLEDWSDESLYFYDLTLRTWPENIDWLLDDLLMHEPPGWKHNLLRKAIPKRLRQTTKAQGIGRKDRAAVKADIAKLFGAVNTLLQRDKWLVGDSISRADISVRSMTSVINRAIEGREALNANPKLRAWEARVDKLTLPKPAPPKPLD